MLRAKLAKLSSPALLQEIRNRLKQLPTLIRLRDQIDAEIKVLQSVAGESAPANAKAAAPKPSPRRRKRRAKNVKPLIQYVREQLTDAPQGVSVAELEKAILSAGYKSSARRIYYQIATILAKGPGFKKVSRGVYALSGQKGPAKKPKSSGKKSARKTKGKVTAPPAGQAE